MSFLSYYVDISHDPPNRTHLIDNEKIKHGDPILFYFSGHGARVQAPSGWPMGWKDLHGTEREIEMILPYDAVYDIQNQDKRISGIPDRTLGSLLRKVARKHGQNITVILDCCASGHGTRSSRVASKIRDFQARNVNPSHVGRLTEDMDRDIWRNDEPAPPARRGSQLRGAFVDRQDDTHVLLAACGRREESYGSIDGGWFTTALITALKDPSIHPRSYAEILKYIRQTFDSWYQDFQQTLPLNEQPKPQNPQCEGINRDRVIFENSAVDRSAFPVQFLPGQANSCEIGIGQIYGVTPGTIFELRQTSMFTNHTSVLGSAVAVEIHPGKTIARVSDGNLLYAHGVMAYVSKASESLRFAVVNDQPDSEAAVALLGQLNERLKLMTEQKALSCKRVEKEDDAEVILRVQPNRVLIDRRDVALSCLKTPDPYVQGGEVTKLFPDVMTWFARFNFHMSRDNPSHPFQNDVEVRLHLLDKPKDDTSLPQEYMIPGKEIPFKNQEAVVSQHESALYCLVLQNYSKFSLYPYIFFFDPTTYGIELFYAPLSSAEAPLKAGRELQLGRSPESMTAISFYVQDGQQVDTGILKVRY